ncbi:thiol-disulfide oxidoreductase DCC family protein [Paenibacillus sp. FSL R7-0331]|uniref:thiol-disulfide oxidoreductase DCC family protein n=1 Tax=Paenibacillus sp. FSL R7-0331 TaxID=1536773 RepID=UPI002F35971D
MRRLEKDKIPEAGQTVVLIDGVCHLCQGLVRFIIPRDPKGHIKFAPLQGEQGRAHQLAAGLEAGRLDTVILLENGRVYTESSAVLHIARKLRYPWPCAYAFIIVPRPLRDRLYRFVARNRYRWFGRDETCLIPSPEIRSRFL